VTRIIQRVKKIIKRVKTIINRLKKIIIRLKKIIKMVKKIISRVKIKQKSQYKKGFHLLKMIFIKMEMKVPIKKILN
jgi:hypothetical protein